MVCMMATSEDTLDSLKAQVHYWSDRVETCPTDTKLLVANCEARLKSVLDLASSLPCQSRRHLIGEAEMLLDCLVDLIVRSSHRTIAVI